MTLLLSFNPFVKKKCFHSKFMHPPHLSCSLSLILAQKTEKIWRPKFFFSLDDIDRPVNGRCLLFVRGYIEELLGWVGIQISIVVDLVFMNRNESLMNNKMIDEGHHHLVYKIPFQFSTLFNKKQQVYRLFIKNF